MTRRHIFFVIMAFIVVTATIFVLKEPSWKSKLDIGLRCDEGISGTLSVISLQPDCDGRRVEDSFDVEAACEKGSLEFSYYTGWADILFTFKCDSGGTTELTSKYGPDIQVEDHRGFFVAIRILNAPPFLVNDRI
ncbi:MAG: hypothetical protein LGR52_11190 [Candidatus Thiosymbion ectosymbiont of Robbea hypermnestra]|nr:hypothetical protein [Candidatus Thiosymbion ectosymbiont of Robbea hypermnestra]